MSEMGRKGNFLDIPEAVNKVVQSLRVYHDPRENSRQVEIEFSDGTELSIEVQARTTVVARLVSLEGGDYEPLVEHKDMVLQEG